MANTKSCDVLIIGGGVIGLSIARELHKKGIRRITIVEKGSCGEEASWAAAGMLGPQAEADDFGEFFKFCCESRDMYPDLAAELMDETGIDIELDQTGTFSLVFTEEYGRVVLDRYYSQLSAGLLTMELMDPVELFCAEPWLSAQVHFGVFFPGDWQVENRKLLTALLRYAELNGITIVENTAIERLHIDGRRVSGAAWADEIFFAGQTVLASGAWSSLIKIGDVDPPYVISPIRGQMLCFQADPGLFVHVVHTGLGYIVPRRDGRILTGSTSEDVGFEKAVTEEAAHDLCAITAEISSFLRDLPVIDRWSGLRPRAPDALPVLGPIAGLGDLFIATGHYRNGILLAPLTAKLAVDKLVNGVDSRYFADFDPERFNNRGVAKSI